MTPRASNVLFGYWSHDIGGFSGSFVDSQYHTESPELFLRWLQVRLGGLARYSLPFEAGTSVCHFCAHFPDALPLL